MKENILRHKCDCCNTDMDILLTNERGTSFTITCPYCESEIFINLSIQSKVVSQNKERKCSKCLHCETAQFRWDYGVWIGNCKFDASCEHKYENTSYNCGKFELNK